MDKRNKNRLILLVIALVFAAPILTALVLNLAGWRPANTRNSGRLVEPPADVSGAAVTLADGTLLQWRDPQWHWTLLALASGDCADACRTRLAELARLRITLGRNADRLRIVYLGVPLSAADTAALEPLQPGRDDNGRFADFIPPESGSVALALVDPNGLLMMRYDAGYDAARLRQDIVKVVH